MARLTVVNLIMKRFISKENNSPKAQMIIYAVMGQ